jgi:hypothetical protein
MERKTPDHLSGMLRFRIEDILKEVPEEYRWHQQDKERK